LTTTILSPFLASTSKVILHFVHFQDIFLSASCGFDALSFDMTCIIRFDFGYLDARKMWFCRTGYVGALNTWSLYIQWRRSPGVLLANFFDASVADIIYILDTDEL
jgi:hypothetical protein